MWRVSFASFSESPRHTVTHGGCVLEAGHRAGQRQAVPSDPRLQSGEWSQVCNSFRNLVFCTALVSCEIPASVARASTPGPPGEAFPPLQGSSLDPGAQGTLLARQALGSGAPNCRHPRASFAGQELSARTFSETSFISSLSPLAPDLFTFSPSK